jgi:hypothetical protein
MTGEIPRSRREERGLARVLDDPDHDRVEHRRARGRGCRGVPLVNGSNEAGIETAITGPYLPPRDGRTSVPSRRIGARRSDASSPIRAGGASRQKCLATTRRRGRGAAERLEGGRSSSVSAYGGSTIAMSNGRRLGAPAPSQRGVGRDDPRPLAARSVCARFAAMTARAARRARRTWRRRRPRDSASIPAAPTPRTGRGRGRPGRSGSRIAKSVCLTRSPSGRVPSPGASSGSRAPVPR